MARTRSDWERIFETWSRGPAATEETKAENAERAVRNAIRASEKLGTLLIDVFAQGSYRNRTNVRQESDVDICIRLMEPFVAEMPTGSSAQDANLTDSDYTYAQFKDDVEEALVDHFERRSVTRGNKAFDVHANTYRVDADVVPTLEYREYYRSGSSWNYRSGVQLSPDRGPAIQNYPDQHYERGCEKNDRSRRVFKRTVRILKRLRNEMADNGIDAAANMPSYFIECLVANVSEEALQKDNYYAVVRWVIADIFNFTRPSADATQWMEVNEIKYLFHSMQPWTKAQANAFADAAWDYIGFEG